MDSANIRLFVDQPISDGQTLNLSDAQAQYLYAVMRQRAGGHVRAFDGQNGEWLARITSLSKRAGQLEATSQLRAQSPAPDLWLCFAPIKKARMDMIVEKATELGATRLLPVITDFAQSGRLRTDRMRAQAIEAAEQCGALHVPQVEDPRPLAQLLADWPQDRPLWFCDEALSDQATETKPQKNAKGALLIGPEGGFSDSERALVRAHPAHVPISLGPLILRAETAAIAGLVKWHLTQGNW